MIRVRYTKLKLLYPILFTLYVCSFTLFTHTHIINNIKYVHSHPFKINETSNHEHTEKELQLLDQIFNTSLTSEILPKIDLSGNLPEYRHLPEIICNLFEIKGTSSILIEQYFSSRSCLIRHSYCTAKLNFKV